MVIIPVNDNMIVVKDIRISCFKEKLLIFSVELSVSMLVLKKRSKMSAHRFVVELICFFYDIERFLFFLFVEEDITEIVNIPSICVGFSVIL